MQFEFANKNTEEKLHSWRLKVTAARLPPHIKRKTTIVVLEMIHVKYKRACLMCGIE